MPPSQDKASIKAKKKSRRPKGGKVGGQKNHKGHTLNKFECVDESIDCEEDKCGCGCNLKGVKGWIGETRQVIDIPLPSYIVTEYVRIDKKCPRCDEIIKGTYPQNVQSNIQYGPNLQALCVGFNVEYKIPYAKISELIEQLYGLKVNTSTLCSMTKKCSRLLLDVTQEIIDYLSSSPVLHADETGMMVKTRNHWMHVLSNAKATYLKLHGKRGADSFGTELTEYTGRLVHDFYSSYFRLIHASHQMCGAHIERECEGLIEEDSKWAVKMKRLLLELYQSEYDDNRARRKAIYARYTRIINQGIREEPPPIRRGSRGREKRTKGLNLLMRLRDHRDEVLEYAFNPIVPFTNNQAERDLRHCKVKQKVSGCFRSSEGAQAYARISSFISTLRKNSINIFEELSLLLNFKPLTLKLT